MSLTLKNPHRYHHHLCFNCYAINPGQYRAKNDSTSVFFAQIGSSTELEDLQSACFYKPLAPPKGYHHFSSITSYFSWYEFQSCGLLMGAIQIELVRCFARRPPMSDTKLVNQEFVCG